MGVLERINTGIIRNVNKVDSQVLCEGNLNNRAHKRFKKIIEGFLKLLGDEVEITNGGVCRNSFIIYRNSNPFAIDCRYEMKNMLLGRTYDLRIQSDTVNCINAIECSEMDDFKVVLRYEGGLRNKKARFKVEKGGAESEELTEILNNRLIEQRALRLQLTRMAVVHKNGSNNVRIEIDSIKGSTTLTILPPLMQMIPFERQDCVDIVELIQMVIHAIHVTVGKEVLC